MPLVVLQDLNLEKEDLTAQIDFMVIARKKTYIIECKSLYGKVTVDDTGAFTREYQYGRRREYKGFYSPVTQNEKHMALLRLTKTKMGKLVFDSFHQSIVVMGNPETVLDTKKAPAAIRSQIVRADQLIHFIQKAEKACREMESGDPDRLEIGRYYLELSVDRDWRSRYQRYEEAILAQKASQPHPSSGKGEKRRCPRCGGELVVCTGKHGKFWGCSHFPKCWYTENIEERDAGACPVQATSQEENK